MAYGRSNIKKYLKDGKSADVQQYAIDNIPVYAANAFFAIASIFCFFFQLIWILTFSYCKPKNMNEGCCRGPCCQKTACWSTLI